ncbi:class I SAM-dependent methyltransferase [Streptomyces sp. 3214.6]|uniref:class I SAM-dependent methyltransferase n=1 Tax=Streptomyces sp. 3214.6 TaxID=1882757 RepID=UPI000909463F|nr:methyltransferase domain-containing protein [Streptomyces sp. 3214.6]SHI16999.1 Ubiquinone/menaquinone biosynthesis C-methylase UbiE [Streptomyces sp. 3214.6]
MADATGFHLKGSAPERYEHYVAPLMAPFVTALVDAADLYPGATVLDLACGTGFAARAAAAQAGPTGRVHGIDIDEDRLELARARHPRLYPDIEFTAAPADALPHPDRSFDVVLCQQGAQYFPDLDAALREAARVTRPQGRFAATVWTRMDQSPYCVAQHRVLTEYAGPDAAAGYAAAFSCTAEHLTGALRRAGYRTTTHHEVTFTIAFSPLEEFALAHLSALSWGRSITDTGGEQALATAAHRVREHVADHTAPDDTATLPFTATLVTATR